MPSHEPLPAPLRLLRIFLLLVLTVVPLLQNIEAAAAPITSCDPYTRYTCPEVDNNGYVLMDSPYAVSPEGPYSIFDCVYVHLVLYSPRPNIY
jgi:hypothetical protein